MKAVERISPKFMSCAAACRGFCKLDSILGECASSRVFDARLWAMVCRLPRAVEELEVAPELRWRLRLETTAVVPVAVTTVLNWRAAIGTRLETSGARSAVTDPCRGHVWRQAFHNLIQHHINTRCKAQHQLLLPEYS